MALFQKSVLNKYLKTLSAAEVEKSFKKFKEFYGKSARLENIRLLKEENYQEGFLREIFVQVLGYTINPDENYNLTTEYKNLTDAKKADGAILDENKAIGVIELKSTKTTSLESITEQAFNYKNHQPNCRYIITSNFEKIRFYIDNATDFEEFNLFTLTEDEFKILFLIISKNSIFNEIPLKLKKESVLHEENISKQLYKDYSNFKRKIFENLVKNNPQFDKLTLFKKSQKLIDRFLFILFGEDSGLLPPNSISRIIKRFKILKEEDSYKQLYDIFKQYFGYMNIGRKGKSVSDNISAYNGGLFRDDKILNSVQIDDDVLLNDSLKLSSYDFQTEVDVNILGHIFENSLNEIEELTAELEGKAVDKKKTKRKKEGVYYTPKYITKYIVENTVGELCTQKKKELNLDKIDISLIKNSRTKQGKLNQKAVDLLNHLKIYYDYLLSLKILDPACGSGAFLNQALEYLIEEHQFVDEYRRQLEKDSLGLFDIKKSILENNIFGVDINEESVEIAKLSLWLRTAERGRKLSDLSNNIKCGNSLIDDPEVAGEKAFKWEKEFTEIMANGGFDAVIGNPPYFNIETLGNNSPMSKAIQNKFPDIWMDKSDIIFYFIARAIQISKNDIGFIVSNAFLFSDKAKKLRNYILKNAPIAKIVNFEKYIVFDDASITTSIIKLEKKKKDNYCKAHTFKDKNYSSTEIINTIQNADTFYSVSLKYDSVFALVNSKINSLNVKIDSNYQKLSRLFKIGSGMQTGANKVFILNKSNNFPKNYQKMRISGEIIDKYIIKETKENIFYFEDVPSFEKLPATIRNHLLNYKESLQNRAEIKRNSSRQWWKYTFSMHKDYYKYSKIWCSYRSKDNIFCFDETTKFIGLTNTTVIFDTNPDYNLKYVLALLNSKVLNFRYKSIGKQTGSGVYEYFENGIGKLPIPKLKSVKQIPFIDCVDEIIKNKYKIVKYYELFEEAKNENNFDKEIELKEIIKYSEQIIDDNQVKIDQKVYNLYGLTEKEIQIVENSFENN